MVNPFESANEASSRAVKQSALDTGVVDRQYDDAVRVRFSNGTTRRCITMGDPPAEDETVLVGTFGDGVPIVIGSVGSTDESTDGSTTFTTDTRPDESEASKGDHWLEHIRYAPKQYWYDAPHDVDTRFRVDDSAIYYASTSSDTVFAVDKSDGSVLWESSSFNNVRSSHVDVDDTSVYCGVEQPSSSDYTIVSLDKTDGSQNWLSDTLNRSAAHFTVDGDGIHGIYSFDEGDASNEFVYSFNSDGTLNWTTNTSDGDVHQPAFPITDSNHLYFGVNENTNENAVVYAFDKTDGSEVWRNEHTLNGTGNVSDQMHVGSTYLYYATGDAADYEWTIRAVDKTDGSVGWTSDVFTGNHVRGVYVDGDVVYVSISNNSSSTSDATAVIQLDSSDGSTNWTYQHGTNPESAYGTIHDGDFFVGINADDEVSPTHRINRDGEQVWNGGARPPHQVESDGTDIFAAPTSSGTLEKLGAEIDREVAQQWIFNGDYWSTIS